MLVEDEFIIATDIKESLENLEYNICALIDTGEIDRTIGIRYQAVRGPGAKDRNGLLQQHTGTQFSHSICTECARKLPE